jgi:DNA-binding transcriptional regulator YhcF (GntR family)
MSRSVFKHGANGQTIRRRKDKSSPFVMLPKWMLASAAWQSLSGEAIAAYIELARRYNGTNNGTLHVSAGELAALRDCCKDTAARALRELVDKGLIEVVRASGFNVKDRKRQAAEYRLTPFYCDVTKQPASKAFMKWQPKDAPTENISRSEKTDSTVRPVRP